MKKLVCILFAAAAFAAPADFLVGPDSGFAAVKGVFNARYERTKDALVFTEIRKDMQIECKVMPLDAARVAGFAFRYRLSGETTSPRTGGELFYAPLGNGFVAKRHWRLPPLARDGKWHEVTVPATAAVDKDDWLESGLIERFRFDPTNADGGRLEIAWFRFVLKDEAAKAAAPAGKFHGEDAWPELAVEMFKTDKKKSVAVKSVSVASLGGTSTPRSQTAGEKVRLRYSYRGPLPEEAFLPVTLVLVNEGAGTVKWTEELRLPAAQCVKTLPDDLWALEFDYELPRYVSPGATLVGASSTCLRLSSGQPPYARLEMKRLAVDPGWPDKTTAKVVDVGGSPWFAVNGKPVYPLWGHVSGTRRQSGSVRHSSAPFNFVTVWAPHLEWWPRGEEFNPESLDRYAELYRREHPDAYFMWDISIYPPPDWSAANPDETTLDEQGNVNRDCGDDELNYSFATEKAYDAMVRPLRKVIDYLEHSPYANRIAGYRVNSGHTIEWLGWDPTRKETILDFSPVAQRGFEAFAREHYPWITDFSVPTLAERRELDAEGGFLWDQRRHARAIAFHDFYSTAVADGAIRMCRAAKEFLGGRKLVGTYFGYVMTLGAGGNGQMRAHYATKHFLSARAADFVMSPHAYSTNSRQPGSQICDMKPFRSIQNNGAVSLIEDDTRTHNGVPVGYCQTLTEQMTVDMMRRNMGVSLCRNQPFCIYAIASGYDFDFPRFADDAAVLAKAGAHAVAKGVRRAAQVAVVVSEEAIKSTPMYHGRDAVEYWAGKAIQTYEGDGKVSRHEQIGGVKNSSFPYRQFYTESAMIGAGVDFLLAEDVADNPGDYRLYVFQTCTKLTPSLLKAAKILRERDCTILWTYAPGYTSDDGSSTGNMKALTGMEFKLCPDVTDPGVTLVDGGEKVGSLVYPHGERPLAPIFAASSPDRVLGRYSNGAAGLAESKTGRARTIFSGSYRVDAPLLQRIARSAGVHIFCDSLDIFESNERFLSFHVRNAGKKTVRLPRKTTVLDVFNRRIVAKGADTFTFDAALHSTYLFYFADDAEELLKSL